MIREFSNDCLGDKVYIDDVANTVKIVYADGSEEQHTILGEDTENILNEMGHPGFAWGSVILQIGKAINKALGGGSSAS